MKTYTKNISQNKREQNQSGFTIIETLVAITILMISIAGPLVVASKGLFGANIAKDQMIASYLAQESMEVVKNIRDNNLNAGNYWLTRVSGCTVSNQCDASALGGVTPIVTCSGGNPCRIYTEANGYGHTAGTASKFSRAFYIHGARDVGAGASAACVSDEECGVTVEVTWYEGTTPYNIVLTSEITSITR